MPAIRDEHLRKFGKFLGSWVGGDLGPFTLYTTRRRKLVWYPRSPPTTGPSPAQARQRDRFRLAIRRWNQLDQPTKNAWNELTLTLHLCAHGLDFWIHLSLRPDRQKWATIVANTGTTLTPPDWIPN